MTEQQAFQQSLGQRAAIDRQKSFVWRSLWACSAKAISSLPVPLSPVMSTVAWVFGEFLDHFQNVADRFALADDVVEVKFHAWYYSLLLDFDRIMATRKRAPSKPTWSTAAAHQDTFNCRFGAHRYNLAAA
jgi:hypothetical protein